MLDSETKTRIDSARDILVGKVPDPKSQVEQITIALIYKFMNDMDRQSEDLGGKATFFSGEHKQYAWNHLLDKRLGGHERLLLYAEGIEKMNENKNIPQLFRDIFRGVFLPYRDPETLNLFLKEINGFTYDHSERLGDAFEYLLSVMDSQGDAGQFRTPRHIIDFIVRVIDPQKHETVLDPACGTAGFLISAYKHILANNTKVRPGDRLSADERGRLMTSFCGYDISPDMVRLSRVNLYLHGFANPRIYEYDTLTSEERWDERYDILMANPPFMTPKGGIRPHNRFSIKAKRSEVLFVDYIAEHLNPNGRAGVIVPEGIIFQSQNAYKRLRRMLVENYLWAVVSLPAGVFNPYSGVKTSILFLDRNFTKRIDEVLFVKVESDGFDLGAQRRPNGKNDLPEALRLLIGHKEAQTTQENGMSLSVSRKRLLDSPDFNLSGDRYRKVTARTDRKWPTVKLGEDSLFAVVAGGTPTSSNPSFWDGEICWATLVDLPPNGLFTELRTTARRITKAGLDDSAAVLLPPKSVLVSTRATIGRIAVSQIKVATNQGFKNLIIKDFGRVNETYVAYTLTRLVHEMDRMASGGTFKELSKTNFAQLKIPLPPLPEQERIVAELEGYRKIIEGGRQIIANYKPTIKIDPGWPIKPLGEVITLQRGYDLPKTDFIKGSVPVVGSNGIIGYHNVAKEKGPGVVTGRSGTIGKVHFIEHDYFWPHNTALFVKEFNGNDRRFIKYLLESVDLKSLGENVAAVPSLDRKNAHRIPVALPPLATQREIVAELEAERALVESNRKLIEIFEAKIKAKLDEIWGVHDEN